MKSFASFRFDDAQTLWRGNVEVALTRKAARVLSCLLDSAGRWVSKSAIMAAVWPETHVQPENVKVLVHEIRLALGDDARAPRFIRSEAGRGYAFVAQVTDAPLRPEPVRLRAERRVFVNLGRSPARFAKAPDSRPAVTSRCCECGLLFWTSPGNRRFRPTRARTRRRPVD